MRSFTVLSAALAFLTATQLVAAQTRCTTFQCPPRFGECNKCTKFNDRIVALTRRVCGSYSLQKCKAIYNGPSGLCDDGCNSCSCGAAGITSTLMACPSYSMDECLTDHPGGEWKCSTSTCTCTPCGLGFSI